MPCEQEENRHSAFYVCFFLGLDPEYDGRMLLRNVGKLVTYYMPYHKTVLFIMDKVQISNLIKV